MAILELVSVTKSYQNGNEIENVLDKIDLSIKNEEFVALVGSSGSGKTTLLNVVGGLLEPTVGCVYVNGINLYGLTNRERTEFRRRNIGFIFQSFNLIPVLNVYENIVLPAKLDNANVDERYVTQLSAALEIEEQLWKLPNTLSGGQQQRVAIARALFMNPAILLADEPTGNLDTASSIEIMELFTKLHEEGATVVLVTHEEDIAAFAGRIIRFGDGQIQSDELNPGKGQEIVSPGQAFASPSSPVPAAKGGTYAD